MTIAGSLVGDNATCDADKLRVSRSKDPRLTVIKAHAAIRGGLINHNFCNGEGGDGLLVVGGRVTVALNTARFAAGVASNSTVTVLASLLSGNFGASKADDD